MFSCYIGHEVIIIRRVVDINGEISATSEQGIFIAYDENFIKLKEEHDRFYSYNVNTIECIYVAGSNAIGEAGL